MSRRILPGSASGREPEAPPPEEHAEAPTAPPAPPRRSAFLRLYYGETAFDFVRRRRIWFSISAAIVIAGIISLAVQGLNLGIEFSGGTSWTVETRTVTVAQAEQALTPAGLAGATITILGTNANGSRTLAVQAKLPKGQTPTAQLNEANSVAKTLATLTNHSSVNAVSIESVGPSWGSQITKKAEIALAVFFVMIALYISIFFEWRMALAAIIAVAHDILVTVGIYSLTGLEVTPDTVVAFLTILGYSLYDTIVVFDRVRDNMRHLSARDRMTFTDVVNLSMNQTLARSINTSLVAVMPILAVLVVGAELLGATTLQYFGLALLVGLTTGAYSSIFIASPLVAVMKEREPRYRDLRQRLEARGTGRALLSPAMVATGAVAQGVDAGPPGAGEAKSAPPTAQRRPAPRKAPPPPPQRRRSSRGRSKGGRR